MPRRYQFGKKKVYREKTLEEMLLDLKKAIEQGIRVRRRKKGKRNGEEA